MLACCFVLELSVEMRSCRLYKLTSGMVVVRITACADEDTLNLVVALKLLVE